MLNNLSERHDERLRAMFDQWLEEARRKPHGELLDDAETIYFKLNDFSEAVNRTEEQKAAALGADDLDLGARLCCGVDFEPDRCQLRDAVAAMAAGECGRREYPREPLPPEYANMDADRLREELLEQLGKEYEDCILGVFLELDKTDAVFQTESCHILTKFYEELRDWLPQAGLTGGGLKRLLEFQRPLDALFTEYEGSGVDEYMGRSSFDDLKEFFPSACTPAPSAAMDLQF